MLSTSALADTFATNFVEILSGNTPIVNFVLDTSGGFTAQPWGLAGNDTAFWIGDVTAGTIPFKTQSGAQQTVS